MSNRTMFNLHGKALSEPSYGFSNTSCKNCQNLSPYNSSPYWFLVNKRAGARLYARLVDVFCIISLFKHLATGIVPSWSLEF